MWDYILNLLGFAGTPEREPENHFEVTAKPQTDAPLDDPGDDDPFGIFSPHETQDWRVTRASSRRAEVPNTNLAEGNLVTRRRIAIALLDLPSSSDEDDDEACIFAPNHPGSNAVASGMTADVYQQTHSELGSVAMKRLIMHEGASLEALQRHLYHEVTVHGQLHHENIVRLHGFDMMQLEMTLEWVEGMNLKQFIQTQPGCRVTWEFRGKAIARDIASALQHVHDKGIIHLDVKPDNILVPSADKNPVKLCDFGHSALLEPGKDFAQTASGSPLYMAPEIMRVGQATDKSDIYSFGMTLWEMTSGVEPFHGINSEAALLTAKQDSKRPDTTSIAPNAARLIQSMWSVKPKDRLSSEELVQRLMN